ncbi:hypothetical protein H632_c1272p1, partial [Helicosporidium sp. ATCC 50920]
MAGTRQRPSGARSGAKPKNAQPLSEDMYTDVERFHKSKLGFEDEEEALSESEGEENVYDLDAGASDSEDGEEDEEEEEDDEEDERIAMLSRQARALEAKLKIARGEKEEGESESEEDDEDARKRGWGSRAAYYSADALDMEASDDEEALADEEEEALRLQREAAAGLDEDDYLLGAGEEENEGGVEADEAAAAAKLSASRQALEGLSEATEAQWVPLDVSELSEAKRLEALEKSSPELLSLLDELRSSLSEARHCVGPLIEELKQDRSLADSKGVSYLEAKNVLLLQYSACIAFFLLLKLEGRRVAGHPVVARLVEIRARLEKVRPIDKKLERQIAKLLAAAQGMRGRPGERAHEEEEEEDALQHGPRLDMLSGPRLAGEAGPGARREPDREQAFFQAEAEARQARRDSRQASH